MAAAIGPSNCDCHNAVEPHPKMSYSIMVPVVMNKCAFFKETVNLDRVAVKVHCGNE